MTDSFRKSFYSSSKTSGLFFEGSLEKVLDLKSFLPDKSELSINKKKLETEPEEGMHACRQGVKDYRRQNNPDTEHTHAKGSRHESVNARPMRVDTSHS